MRLKYGAIRKSGLNWQRTSRKQRKPLQFKEKQLAANQRDELFGFQVGATGGCLNKWWRNMRWCALAICKTSCEYQASVSVAVAMSSRLRLRGSRVNAYESGGGTGLMLLCRETKGRKGGRQTGRDDGRKKAGQPSSNDGWPARIPCGPPRLSSKRLATTAHHLIRPPANSPVRWRIG